MVLKVLTKLLRMEEVCMYLRNYIGFMVRFAHALTLDIRTFSHALVEARVLQSLHDTINRHLRIPEHFEHDRFIIIISCDGNKIMA